MSLEQQYQHEAKPRREPPKGVACLPARCTELGAASAMYAYIYGRGLDCDIARDNCWYPAKMDTLRIVCPATNTLGYVYYQARAIDPSVTLRYLSPYYASGDSIIIVWPHPYKRLKRVAIVEGPFDALAAAGEGWIGVALMGKEPQPEVYDHICSRFPGHAMVVVADADGIQDAGQIVSTLAARGISAQLKLTGYKDLAAMPAAHREKLLA